MRSKLGVTLTAEELDKLEKELPPTIRIVVRMMRSMIEQLHAENAELKRILFGKKSEKLPSARRKAAKRAREDETDEQKSERKKRTQQRRKRAREQKQSIETEELLCQLPQDDRICKKCGGDRFVKVGEGHVNFRPRSSFRPPLTLWRPAEQAEVEEVRPDPG
ncbi:MAG: hypothetical protein GY722_28745 [bacterium]|nr:hypothetical protein [bacterium]